MNTQTENSADSSLSTAQNGNGHHHGTNSAPNFIRPRAHIVENHDGYVLQVELPGVNKAGLEVTVENGELTIVGHRHSFETKAELVYRESRPADFRRIFELDPSIDTARISGAMEQGVLTLTMPKAEAARPRRIEIGGSN
jgi:HSP20 family protein